MLRSGSCTVLISGAGTCTVIIRLILLVAKLNHRAVVVCLVGEIFVNVKNKLGC